MSRRLFFSAWTIFTFPWKSWKVLPLFEPMLAPLKTGSGRGQKWIHAGVHHRIYGSDERCVLTGRTRSHLEIFDTWNYSWFFTTGTGPAECWRHSSLIVGPGWFVWLWAFRALVATELSNDVLWNISIEKPGNTRFTNRMVGNSFSLPVETSFLGRRG